MRTSPLLARRPARRTYRVSRVPGAAALVGLALLGGLLAPLSPAEAGSQGTWTTVLGPSAAGTLDASARPSMVRTGDDVLHVVTRVRTQDGRYALVHVALAEDGTPQSTSTITSGWRSLAPDPRLLLDGTRLEVVFSGVRGDGEPDDGRVRLAFSDETGAAWTTSGTPLTRTAPGSARGLSAVPVGDGSLITAFTRGDRSVGYRVGAAADLGRDDRRSDPLDRCCAVAPAVGRLFGTNLAYLAWAGTGTTAASAGVFVQQISPQIDDVRVAPRSSTIVDGTPRSRRFASGTPIVSTGSGVFIAYPVGYPKVTGIAVLDVTRSRATPAIVPTPEGADDADLTVGFGPRLWLAWRSGGTVRVARSDTSTTRFGPAVSLGAPTEGGRPRAHGLQIDAQGTRGQGTVVVATGTRLVHTSVRPALSLGASPTSWSGARRQRVVLRVTDVGEPVTNARVRLAGRTCTTGADGRCTIVVEPRRAGTLTARADSLAYSPGSRTLRVR
ncbi:hypothetical protein K8Z61_07865 [Nocardioides sp. TRM66260-LWL]|uniref:hypothetical protein n=1 Tax=Nocardioides sp. TRM66260-LWL TaxID=2874478 RepID=UPI001CC645D5|nr:hypothetical protein [Nocardioides sp. TRM66260-LWL]MBZ5734410.1 hypothetical protein [Nocardioides sp. TRM66260-LWL]